MLCSKLRVVEILHQVDFAILDAAQDTGYAGTVHHGDTDGFTEKSVQTLCGYGHSVAPPMRLDEEHRDNGRNDKADDNRL